MCENSLIVPLNVSAAPFISDLFDGTTLNEQWDCDIRSILHDLIKAHNEYVASIGDPPEESFLQSASRPTTLASLICQDMKYIAQHVPTAMPTGRVFVTEINSSTLAAELLDITGTETSYRVLGFHSGLIMYLNDFFPKFHIMLSDRYARCLPQHRSIMEGKEYEDSSLLLSLYNNAEVLMNPSAVTHLDGPAFLGEPFDVCEQVEGSRRFAILHEFGHVWYRDIKIRDANNLLDNTLGQRFASRSFYYIAMAMGVDANSGAAAILSEVAATRGVRGAERIRQVAEELWCDLYAFTVIEQLFRGRLRRMATVYECGNAVVGVMDLFFLLSVIERGTGKYLRATSNYPSSDLRASLIFDYIGRHHYFSKYSPTGRSLAWEALQGGL